MTIALIVIDIVFGVLAISATFLSWYLYIKEKIATATIDAINAAEEIQAVGEERKELAVNQVYCSIPKAWRAFFPRLLVEQLVQLAFNKIKEYAIKHSENRKKKEEAGDEH